MSGTTQVPAVWVEAVVTSTEPPTQVPAIWVEVVCDIPPPPAPGRVYGLAAAVLRTGDESLRVYGLTVPVLRQDRPPGKVYGLAVSVLRSIEDGLPPDDDIAPIVISSGWSRKP